MVGYSFLDDSFIRNSMPVYPGANQPCRLLQCYREVSPTTKKLANIHFPLTFSVRSTVPFFSSSLRSVVLGSSGLSGSK
jgi:hypothetical protein